jgi:hypothetical protein
MGGDYGRAILREERKLYRVFLSLSAMADLYTERRSATPLTRAARNAILRLLRPAEAALCRLIVMVMHQMYARQGRAAPSWPQASVYHSRLDPLARLFPSFPSERRELSAPFLKLSPQSPLTFPGKMRSFDSCSAPFLLRRLRDAAMPGSRSAAPRAPSVSCRQSPDEVVSARALCERIHALRRALETLPQQASRLACWQVRLRFMRQPLPRKLMGVRTLLEKPPSRSKTKRPPANDTPAGQPAGRLEFLRWKPG